MVKNKKLVLIAEDDRYISMAYRDGLIRAGFDVVTAMDGVETITKIKSNKPKPDLILLDLILPTKNGFEVLKEIKKDTEINNIPVIILSNLGQDTDIVKGKEFGAVDYLVKSDYSMKEVIEKVKFHLKIII